MAPHGLFVPFITTPLNFFGKIFPLLYYHFCDNVFCLSSGMRNVSDLLSMCTACRDRVNPYLFNYALSVAILHRPDTRNLQVPPLFESFPDKFVDGAVFGKAREESEIFPSGSRVSICVYCTS